MAIFKGPEEPNPGLQQEVLTALGRLGGEATAGEIAQAVGRSRDGVWQALHSLRLKPSLKRRYIKRELDDRVPPEGRKTRRTYLYSLDEAGEEWLRTQMAETRS